MENILLHTFQTPFESVPFSQIKQEDYQPAILTLIDEAKVEVNKIVAQTSTPTFENTILELEGVGKQLNRVAEAFFNITSAETNDFLENVQAEISPVLAAFGNDINLNEGLWIRVKSVYDAKDQFNLDPESLRLLEKTYEGFLKNGALLSNEQKDKLRKIDEELSITKVKFSQNVLQETNNYFLHLTTENDVDGLPESIVAAAAMEAKERGLDGWVITLQFPSYVPFMKYANNRKHRATLHSAYGQRAFKNNEFNNSEHVKTIVRLKDERAKLLGFESHAAFVLKDRMAGNASTVNDFLSDLLIKAFPAAQQDIELLKPLAKADGIDQIQAYDHAYYAEKLRKQKFDIDEEALKPYFSLDKVRDAAFDLAYKLYDITFIPATNIDTYHPDVMVYEVQEGGNHKALLYTDWHPRPGKRAGAWMTSFKGQYKDEKGNHRPHISIVCNFAKPTDEAPSLLTFNEVTTLFHEFGHALHGILAETKYESLSGTNVYWDFVELPSQFMENFCYQKSFLQTFAKHYATGEALPDVEIDKIVASGNFMEGYQTVRQLSFGMLDMAYHNGYDDTLQDIATFEQKILAPTLLYPVVEGVTQSTAFSHIFGGGYSAGYYSYKWAEVLDADAFAYFKEKGIYNKQVADKFKKLLSSGGTVDPMELYIQFRGRKPDNTALLMRAGLN